MTESQLSKIYKAACAAVGKRPDPEAAPSWKRVLLHFTQAEVQAALDGWWEATTPVQGSLIEKPRGSTMPTASDLKARIVAARAKAAENSAQARQRRQQIEEFWQFVAERGIAEDEVREKWPSYVGTRPAERGNAA